MQLRDIKNEVYLSIHWNKREQVLEVEWDGYASHVDSARGWDAILDAIESHRPQRVLHDARNRLGNPELSLATLAQRVLPRLERLDWTLSVALLRPESLVAQLGADKMYALLDTSRHHFCVFDDLQEAHAWLQNDTVPTLAVA
jgi:hypothetical protein